MHRIVLQYAVIVDRPSPLASPLWRGGWCALANHDEAAPIHKQQEEEAVAHASDSLNRRGGVGHGLLDGIVAVAQLKQGVHAGLALRDRFHREILGGDAIGDADAANEQKHGETDGQRTERAHAGSSSCEHIMF